MASVTYAIPNSASRVVRAATCWAISRAAAIVAALTASRSACWSALNRLPAREMAGGPYDTRLAPRFSPLALGAARH